MMSSYRYSISSSTKEIRDVSITTCLFHCQEDLLVSCQSVAYDREHEKCYLNAENKQTLHIYSASKSEYWERIPFGE